MVTISSPFALFAETANAVSATTKRLEKLAILGSYLSPLSDDDLAIASLFLSGLPFPASDDRTLNVGFSAVSTVLIELTGVDPYEYNTLAVRLGDLGEVAEHVLNRRRTTDDGRQIFRSGERFRTTHIACTFVRGLR